MIPAGGTGTLTAKIATKSTQNGIISKSVSVTTDAPGAERLTLNVRFTAVSAVMVLPRPQLSLRGVEGDSPSASVILRRGDGEPMEVTKIDNTDDRISITTEPVDDEHSVAGQRTRPGDVVLTVSLSPDLGPTSYNGRFRVRTNHPDSPPVDVVYMIRTLPLIQARPEQTRLVLQRGNESGRSSLLRIQHNRSGRFKITGAEPSDPELLKVELLDAETAQQVHTAAIMLQDGVEPGSLSERRFESVTFATDDPDHPKIEVQVQVEPREMRRPGQAAPAP